ncbi:MAG: carbamoyltransferase HypF [Desulfuromonas sp.]|nr:MAG: carbamoyltransferase HypF [Desulfuromonas sp.]
MILRKRIEIEGVVQGVGFRPFVYNSALYWGVSGYVLNNSRGVVIEVEGPFEKLAGFLWKVRSDTPPLASISRFEVVDIDPCGDDGFVIRESEGDQQAVAQISPDTFVCDACLEELFDPDDRRYRYPFINCTDCGPRYTIVTGIPYDRPKTTMADFTMCPSCQAEYDDPSSRRFHAQPNACPDCGPQVELCDADGAVIDSDDPVARAVELLRQGKIVAVKGLGGYHLAVDAENEMAVARLRERKKRDEKPFAMMVSSVEQVLEFSTATPDEIKLLGSVERPIVLIKKKEGTSIAASVAPRNNYFGVMLPYTPLHHLLLKEYFTALVMTSGNISDEPIAFEDDDATTRLAPIADCFLHHNRRIYMRADDSIGRIIDGKAVMLRRSRGYVPRALFLSMQLPEVLATGAELKSTICLTQGDRAYLSQYIGDLKNDEVYGSFCRTIDHLEGLLEIKPKVIAHDLHPDFYSTGYAEGRDDLERVPVQHHHAHLASCLAENGYEKDAIGIIFDGLGYGIDGNIWGGEFLVGGYRSFKRMGHFSHIAMPGGDAAVKEPFRMALSYLFRVYGEELPDLELVRSVPKKDLQLLRQMVDKGLNSPLTSSCGRLFDGVSALLGLRRSVTYEGQSALELEQAADPMADGCYPFNLVKDEGGFALDYSSLISAIVDDIQAGESVGEISGRFHNTIANVALSAARRIWSLTGLETVALSGGVFQNRLLTEKVVHSLRDDGFTVLTHAQVPPNDGGLALGQAVIAAHQAGI